MFTDNNHYEVEPIGRSFFRITHIESGLWGIYLGRGAHVRGDLHLGPMTTHSLLLPFSGKLAS